MTVKQAVEDYLTDNSHRWKGGTYTTYTKRAETFIFPALGKVLVVELDTRTVQRWADGLRKAGVARSTIDGARAILAGMYKDLIRLGAVSRNPVANIRVGGVASKAYTTWTFEQVQAVLASLADDPMWHAMYRVALFTGMRPGELRVLRWSSVDLDDGVIRVERHEARDDEGRVVDLDGTKTGAGRSILVPASVVAALKTWRARQRVQRMEAASWDARGYVFTAANGHWVSQAVCQRRHEVVVKTAQVPRVTLHEMRHTYATMELASGTDIKIVSVRLGHANVEMTMNVYQHVSLAMQEKAVVALETRLA
ncbi:MAG: site-specific integrase [Thermomicrobiales bacterium]